MAGLTHLKFSNIEILCKKSFKLLISETGFAALVEPDDDEELFLSSKTT